MQTHLASCLCGAVNLTAKGPPLRTGICHCTDCRKHHGAAFYAAAIFASANVVIQGETRSYKGRHFCPQCGSSIFAQSDQEVEVHLGALDTAAPKPSYEVWTQSRFDWVTPLAGATQHKSNRADD